MTNSPGIAIFKGAQSYLFNFCFKLLEILLSQESSYFSHSPWRNVQLKNFVWNILMKTCLVIVTMIKRALDKYNIILQLSPKRVEIFILLEVLACVMTACWILHSSLIYFWRNIMHISSIFYFSKSTSINTQYSSLWDTLNWCCLVFTKYLIKWKCFGRISWKFQYRFYSKLSIEVEIGVILVQCPFKRTQYKI